MNAYDLSTPPDPGPEPPASGPPDPGPPTSGPPPPGPLAPGPPSPGHPSSWRCQRMTAQRERDCLRASRHQGTRNQAADSATTDPVFAAVFRAIIFLDSCMLCTFCLS